MKVTMRSIQCFVIVALQQWLSVSSTSIVDSIVTTVQDEVALAELTVLHPHIYDPTLHLDLYMEQINHFRNVTSSNRRRRMTNVDESKDGQQQNVRRTQACGKDSLISLNPPNTPRWHSVLKDTSGTHLFNNSDILQVRFNIQDTTCTTDGKHQNAWAYYQFKTSQTCDLNINDIILKASVNQNVDMTDYLNVFIDGKFVAQYSGNPIKPLNECSNGPPKVRKALQDSIKLNKKMEHDIAIQVATNPGKIHHQNSFYDITFAVN